VWWFWKVIRRSQVGVTQRGRVLTALLGQPLMFHQKVERIWGFFPFMLYSVCSFFRLFLFAVSRRHCPSSSLQQWQLYCSWKKYCCTEQWSVLRSSSDPMKEQTQIFLCVSSNRLYSVLSPGSACSCKSPQSWQAEAYSRFTASTLQQVYGYYFYFREPQFMLNKGTLLKSILSLP